MKQIISICVCISILYGCGSMRGLQRQASQKLHQTTNENNELYWNAPEGHNNDVKMLITDEYHTQIKIPVIYTEKIENIEKIKMIPNVTQEEIEELYAVGKCDNCTLDNENLTLDIAYKDDGTGIASCAWNIALSPVLVPLGFVLSLFSDNISSTKEMFEESCNRYKLQDFNPIYISKPTFKLEDKKTIQVAFEISPASMNISCNKKACSVLDENGKHVNKVFINKTISANQKYIEELIDQDKKEKAKQAQQREQLRKLQAKECPVLYRKIQVAQLARSGFGYNVDPIALTKVAQRFEELGCGFWYNEQLN